MAKLPIEPVQASALDKINKTHLNKIKGKLPIDLISPEKDADLTTDEATSLQEIQEELLKKSPVTQTEEGDREVSDEWSTATIHVSRVTKKTYEDKANGVKLVIERVYAEGPDSPRMKAVREHKMTLESC